MAGGVGGVSMSEAPHLVERPPPPAPTRNALHLIGRVQSDLEIVAAGMVRVRVATPDPAHLGAHDVHRIECSGDLASTALRLSPGDLVAVLGALHYGAEAYHRAYVRAQTIKRAPDTGPGDRRAVVLPPKTTSDYVDLFAAGEMDAAESLAREYASEHWPDGDSMKIDVESGGVFLSPEAEPTSWPGAARRRGGSAGPDPATAGPNP